MNTGTLLTLALIGVGVFVILELRKTQEKAARLAPVGDTVKDIRECMKNPRVCLDKFL